VISGDLSNTFENTLKIVDYIRHETSIPIYFISENHDVWTYSGKDSLQALHLM